MRLRSLLAAGLALGAVLAATACGAQDTTSRPGVRIGLTYAGTNPGVLVLPIAGPHGDSIRTIVQRDLDHGDRVRLVAATGPLPAGQDRAGNFNYKLYGELGVQGLVQIVERPDGALRAILHDIGQAKAIGTRDFPAATPALGPRWRMSVHALADELEEWLTGTRGVSATRVAFVRERRVWLVDSDGHGVEAITDGPVMSPAWHPSGRYLAYQGYNDRGSQIAVRDLETGQSRFLVATRSGLNMTPAWFPDGQQLVYAHGLEAGTDLYVANPFGSGAARQVTVGRGTDNVSPTVSPDGRRVAFTSGRSGHPEVYISDADGTNPELLTPYDYGAQSYRSNPDWSPDGRTVAFQSQIAGQFQVMTIALRDRALKQLTSEGVNEDPSWAPDGRHLVFTSNRSGRRELWVMDVESGRARQLTKGGDARLAAWSPRLAAGR